MKSYQDGAYHKSTGFHFKSGQRFTTCFYFAIVLTLLLGKSCIHKLMNELKFIGKK